MQQVQRKLVLSMLVSIDGYMEGPDNDINWHVFDTQMSDYMMNFFKTVDTFLYGRKSYELMLEYWPHQKGEFADIMNTIPKIVFSRTLDEVTWNSMLVKSNVNETIKELKRKNGKDMVLFAGADMASTLINHGLIDEYRLIVNPVVLGRGTPLFKDIDQPFSLQLTDVKRFDCGNAILIYSKPI